VEKFQKFCFYVSSYLASILTSEVPFFGQVLCFYLSLLISVIICVRRRMKMQLTVTKSEMIWPLRMAFQLYIFSIFSTTSEHSVDWRLWYVG